jgi:DNA polymerase-1
MPTLLLIDGHSQAYRAYFGMKTPLTTRSGEPTGAVYGFARKLLSVLKEYRPEYVATAFDAGDTWRHAEFPAYKGTRESMPDDMRPQMERIAQLVRAFNIPLLTYENFEADDILGALGREAGEQGFDVLIMSGDRDMFQLVTERVKILYTSGGPNPATTVYGPAEVQERYGLTPRQFIDYKALTGDSSDNIPGVPGVGDKTATKLLQQFDSIEGIYADLAAVSGDKLKKNLQEHRRQVEQNLRLVTIVTQLDDLHFDAEACKLRDYDPERVTALFLELEFRTLARELPEADLGAGQAPAAAGAANHRRRANGALCRRGIGASAGHRREHR